MKTDDVNILCPQDLENPPPRDKITLIDIIVIIVIISSVQIMTVDIRKA